MMQQLSSMLHMESLHLSPLVNTNTNFIINSKGECRESFDYNDRAVKRARFTEASEEKIISSHFTYNCTKITHDAQVSMSSFPFPLLSMSATPGTYMSHAHNSFPVILYVILSRPDLADIISWMPDGTGWTVWRPREFEIRVLPSYFKHQKFSSFINQARSWGFQPVPGAMSRHSYYYPGFQRDHSHMVTSMLMPGM